MFNMFFVYFTAFSLYGIVVQAFDSNDKMGTLWPETVKFCGLLPLKVGVYIYIAFHLIWNGFSIKICWDLIDHVLSHDNSSLNYNSTEMNVEEEDVNRFARIMNALRITTTVYLSIQLFSVVFLVIGIWKSRPVMLKFYVYYSVTIWVVHFILGYIIAFFLDMAGRTILLGITLTHGYMLLTLRTFYLQEAGKLKPVILHSDLENLPSNVGNTAERCTERNLPNTFPHCHTCTCNEDYTCTNEITELNSTTQSIEVTTNSRTSDCDSETGEGKKLNFKDDYIIYDEEQLRSRTDAGAASSTIDFNRIENDVAVSQPIQKNQNRVFKNNHAVSVARNENQSDGSPTTEDNPVTRSSILAPRSNQQPTASPSVN